MSGDDAGGRVVRDLGAAHASGGERRQVTVLFADLVDSTRLAAGLDPEDYREVLRAYHACCAGAARRNGGFVAQYLGDGVMVYFGYPEAREDAAEQAVRTGRDILRAVADLSTTFGRLEARAGIATGLAVVGDIVGSGASEYAAVTGRVANLASRVQAVAKPGMVAIAEETHALLRDSFHCTDLGAHRFKGVDAPVRVWAVEAERDFASRFEADGPRPSTAMIGRDQEVRVLLAKWEAAEVGSLQVVRLIGEPGIGKSRLLREIRREIRGRSSEVALLQCSPRHVDSPLFPVLSCLRQVIGFRAGESPDAGMAKLDAFLSEAGLASATPLLGAALSMSPDHTTLVPAQSAQEERRRVFSAIRSLIQRIASRAPLLLILEDAHWADRSTDEFVGELLESCSESRILLLVAARPDHAPAWTTHPAVTRLVLQRLASDDARRLVGSIVSDRVSQGVVEQILRRSEGVPLFLEEIAEAVLDASASGATQPSGIPTSLQDGLMARLDRLGRAKRTAQVASVLGRTFAASTLSAMMDSDPAGTADDLALLQSAGLIYRRADQNELDYAFKHALLQEAAHESLLRSARAVLHGRAAGLLESSGPHMAASEPEVLAHHWEAAGSYEKAAKYWLGAGQRALSRAANVEAIAHLDRALKSLAAAREMADRELMEFNIHLCLAQASYVVNGPAHPRTVASYTRAQGLIGFVGDADQRTRVLYGIFSSYHFASKLDLAEQPARRALELAEQERSRRRLCQAYRMLGYLSFFRGELADAEKWFDLLARTYDPGDHAGEAYKYGADCLVGTQAFHAVAESVSKPYRHAAARAQANVERARALRHPASIGWAYAASCYVHYFARDLGAAEATSKVGMAYCEAHDVASWYAHCRLFHIWARARLAGEQGGSAEVRRIIGLAGRGNLLGLPLFRAVAAELLLLEGHIAQALGEAEAAVAEATASGQFFFEPLTKLVRAECLTAAPPSGHCATKAFEDTVLASRRIGTPVIELRAARALANLIRAEGPSLAAPLRERIRDLDRMLDPLGSPEDDRPAKRASPACDAACVSSGRPV